MAIRRRGVGATHLATDATDHPSGGGRPANPGSGRGRLPGHHRRGPSRARSGRLGDRAHRGGSDHLLRDPLPTSDRLHRPANRGEGGHCGESGSLGTLAGGPISAFPVGDFCHAGHSRGWDAGRRDLLGDIVETRRGAIGERSGNGGSVRRGSHPRSVGHPDLYVGDHRRPQGRDGHPSQRGVDGRERIPAP